MHSLKL